MGEQHMTVVVLDPIEPGQPKPDYCVHGRCTCIACDDWCWLGHATHDAVIAGRAQPICRPCANRLLPPDARRVARILDRRRSEGPHTTRPPVMPRGQSPN